jgi:hypothetical protein
LNRIRFDKFALAIEEDGKNNIFEKIRFITVMKKSTYASVNNFFTGIFIFMLVK